VAIITKPAGLRFRGEGLVLKVFSDASLCFQTCLIMRSGDDSRLANEFARSFLRRYADHRRPPKPIELPPLSAKVVSMKKANAGPRGYRTAKFILIPVSTEQFYQTALHTPPKTREEVIKRVGVLGFLRCPLSELSEHVSGKRTVNFRKLLPHP